MRDGTVVDRRLVVVTQVIDPNHPNLGYVVAILRGLAERWPDLKVVARAGDRRAIPDIDCEILPWSGSRIRKAAGLAAATNRALRGGSKPVVLAHQCPAFALAAWPIVKGRGGRLALFYAHGFRSKQFGASERLVDVMLTSTAEGCPSSRPIRTIGQGIAPMWFVTGVGELPDELRLVTCGRISPVKNLHLVIESLARLRHSHPSASLDIIGRPETVHDSHYVQTLHEQVERLGLAACVRFVGALSPSALASHVRGAFAAVNLSNTHSLDKAILEAAASGVPVVTSNRAARTLLLTSEVPWLAIEASPVGAEVALRRLLDPAQFKSAARSWRAIADEHTLDRFLENLSSELQAIQ